MLPETKLAELIGEVKNTMESISTDMVVVESGKRNKTAAARVRKNSLKLEKQFKEFRKLSIRL